MWWSVMILLWQALVGQLGVFTKMSNHNTSRQWVISSCSSPAENAQTYAAVFSVMMGTFLLTSIVLCWAKDIFCLFLKTGNCRIKFKIWNSHIVIYKITIIIVRYEVAIAIQLKYTLFQVCIPIVLHQFAVMIKKITFERYILRLRFTIIRKKVQSQILRSQLWKTKSHYEIWAHDK